MALSLLNSRVKTSSIDRSMLSDSLFGIHSNTKLVKNLCVQLVIDSLTQEKQI